jgi:predicted hydrocarbon binding protein
MDENPVPYFTLPSIALKSLFDEIRISVEPDMAEEIIERYGMRCGEGIVKTLGVEGENLTDFGEIVHPLWAHVGLGRPNVTDVSDDEIVVEFKESIEAQAKGKSEQTHCTFLLGYMKGLVTEAIGGVYDVEESTCIAMGSEVCKFYIRPLRIPQPLEGEEDLPTLEPVAEPKYDIGTGYSYLVLSEESELGYDVFKDLLGQGHPGFCVTRTFPTKIMKQYGIKVPILWLTKEQGEGTLVPHNLAKLNFLIEEFIKKEENAVVLLDGLEYLITHNNYEPILRFLQILNDKVAIGDSILIMPINPGTLDNKNLKLLEREFEVFKPEPKKEENE